MAVYENFLQKCFREKVILFPYDGLHSLKSPAYPVKEVFISFMMAAALFPHEDEEKQFLGYVAQYFADFMKQFEESDTLDLINAKDKIRLLNELACFPLLFFGSSHAFCEALLNWKPFSKNGKGSLREKFDQGLFFGDVYQRFLFDKITIKEAIRATSETIKRNMSEESITTNPFPSLENNNIYTNYWPRFKSVAWIWYAIRHLVPGPVLEQRVEVCHSTFSTIEGNSNYKGLDGWYEIFTDAFTAYLKVKNDGQIDRNGIDTWCYSDTLEYTELESFFPMENLKALNDIFSGMPRHLEICLQPHNGL